MFLHVTAVRHVRDRVLEVSFNDGSRKQVDLTPHIWGPAFEVLHDDAYFKSVRVDPESGTVAWPNGADFAPEFLHRIGVDIEQPA